MKTKLASLLALTLFFSLFANAQYVTIPDSSLRFSLKPYYPGCFNSSNQMDTTCADILNENQLSLYNISLQAGTQGLQYFKGLKHLSITNTELVSLNFFPPNINLLELTDNSYLDSIAPFPDSLSYIEIFRNYNLTKIPHIPDVANYVRLENNNLTSLPNIPANINLQMGCSGNQISSLPKFTEGFSVFDCSNNKITQLPDSIGGWGFYCDYNQISVLPPQINFSDFSISHNQLTSLPALPGVNYLNIAYNNIQCLPLLPRDLSKLTIDTLLIKCLPNLPNNYLKIYSDTTDSAHLLTGYPVCNTTNNIHGCRPFPVIAGNFFYDLNTNGIKDINESCEKYGMVRLSTTTFAFSNDSGFYQISANDTGTFNLNVSPPAFFTALPANKSFTFSSFDTSIVQNIALQPFILKDSLSIQLIPWYMKARPGFPFSFTITYQNSGTTILAATDVVLQYDSTLLNYVNSTNANVANIGNTISLHLPSLPVGFSGSFDINFFVSPSAALGNYLNTYSSLTSGAITNTDTSRILISSSYDPNNIEATPIITPQQVANGHYIDYIIRFQNKGNDTAIHIVIADTLNTKLKQATLEVINCSASVCNATVNENVVMFEMRNIMLPDIHTNEPKSHGFVRFRIKPVNNLVLGDTIENKAGIYFDYNTPVITNVAITRINALQTYPLNLLSFNGYKTNNESIRLVWSTTNETNTHSFEIEESYNGQFFYKVGEIKAKGNSNNNYSFIVNENRKPPFFFRLKMKDKDGHFTFSQVIAIRMDNSNNSFFVNENPVNNRLILAKIAPGLLNTEATLVNNIGMTVKRFIINSDTQVILVDHLPAGPYYLHTQAGNKKIVITKK